jgi:hypothetical protein
LIDDLLGDPALASFERVDGYDRAFQRQHLQQLRHGGDSLNLASVAIRANAIRCSHPQAQTICSAGLPLLGRTMATTQNRAEGRHVGGHPSRHFGRR